MMNRADMHRFINSPQTRYLLARHEPTKREMLRWLLLGVLVGLFVVIMLGTGLVLIHGGWS